MNVTDVSEQTDVSEVSAQSVAISAPPTTAEAESPVPAAAGSPGPEPADAPDSMDDAVSLMEQFLSDPSHDYKTLKYGDVMDGIIMHVDREELLVDIGSKSEGIVPSKEYSSLSSDERQQLHVGDTVLVFVVQPENQEGHAVVSIDRARQEKSWRRLQELYEANEVIEAEVTNYNKGGLLVNLDGVRGFVPASQVSEIRGGDEASKQADMARMIGSSLALKVIEINRHRNRLILSERQAVQERRDVMKERLIEELKEGETRKGRVSSICDFGAFVDIGGADGLVHLSELSWSRVRHPSEVLRVGQEVDVYVLGINAQEKKIALSIKRTQAEPWSRVAAAYEVGQLVRGTVTQLANFGAFARIEDGVEGLIHVSELTDERITHPKQVVKEGQDLLLRIIRIDPQRRRMGLSLRRALDTPDAELIGVFGPDATTERDRIIAQINEALEAEGIEPISRDQPAETGEPGESAPAGAEPAPEQEPAVPEAPTAETPPPAETPEADSTTETTASAAAAAGDRSQMRRSRPGASSEAASIPLNDLTDERGEPLSAMAMAFAAAGAAPAVPDTDTAPSAPVAEPDMATATTSEAVATTVDDAPTAPEMTEDAVVEVSTTESTDEPIDAAAEVTARESTDELVGTTSDTADGDSGDAPSEAVADADADMSAADSGSGDTDESGSENLVVSVVGTITGAVESVTGTVIEKVQDLVEAVKPDTETTDEAAEPAEAAAVTDDQPTDESPVDGADEASSATRGGPEIA